MFIKETDRRKFTYFKQIRYDIKAGILSSLWKYIPVMLIFAASCLYMRRQVKAETISGILRHPEISLADYMIFAFKGMEKYVWNPDDPRQMFDIPAMWLLMNLYLAYIVGSYPLRDLHSYGQQILIRSKKRAQWWAGKVVWNIASVLLFYAVGYLTMICVCLATGSLSLVPSAKICQECSEIDPAGWAGNAWLVVVILQPIISSLALCLVQMAVAFFIRPAFSYMVTILVLVLSAFYCNPFFIGNYSMLLRSDLALPGGVPFRLAVWFGGLLAAAAMVVGVLRFKKMDILEKE